MSDDRTHEHTDEDVEEAGEESFPASDPPAYSGGTATPKEDSDRDPGHLDKDPDGKEA